MKLSVVLFVVLVASVCAGDPEKAHREAIQKIVQKCMVKLNLKLEEVQQLLKEDKPNQKLDCLHGCMFVEQRFLNEDGTANKAVVDQIVKALASHENGKAASEAFKKCLDFKKKMSLCEAGRVLDECLRKMPH